MVRVLTTGDENTGQTLKLPVPGRSSPLVVGTADASAFGGAPWGSASFVDPLTSLPLPAQTGAPATPYSTAQLAADATASGNAIVLGPGAAGPVNVVQKAFTFYGFGLIEQGFSAFDRPRVDGLIFADPSLSNMVQRFVNVHVTGAVVLNTEGFLSAQGSEFTAGITGVLSSEFNDSTCRDTLTCDSVVAVGSTFDGEVTSSLASFQTSRTGGNVNASTACSFRNHTWGAVPTTVTSPAISLDYYSFAAAALAGVAFTTPPVVVDAPTGGGPFIFYFRIGNGVSFPGIQYAGPWGTSHSSTEFVAALLLGRNTTFRNMRIKMTSGLLSNNAATFTLKIAGVLTAITATVPFAGTQADDLVNVAAGLVGDLISMEVDGGANAFTNSGVLWVTLEGS